MWLQDEGILVNLNQALAVLPEFDAETRKWVLVIVFGEEHAVYLGQWNNLADVEDFVGQLAAELFINGQRVKKVRR